MELDTEFRYPNVIDFWGTTLYHLCHFPLLSRTYIRDGSAGQPLPLPHSLRCCCCPHAERMIACYDKLPLDTGTVECNFGDLFFDAEFTSLTGISDQKHAVAVTTVKQCTAFRTGTVNSSSGYEETSKQL